MKHDSSMITVYCVFISTTIGFLTTVLQPVETKINGVKSCNSTAEVEIWVPIAWWLRENANGIMKQLIM